MNDAQTGQPLILKRASTNRPSGEWREDDYDVLADGGRGQTAGSHAHSRLRGDARDRPTTQATPMISGWSSQGGRSEFVRGNPTSLGAVLAACLMVIAIAGSAVAGQLEDGLSAIQRGDYATAMRLLRPLANQSDPMAQTLIGHMYDVGWGVPQNIDEAIKWYRRAADQGQAISQFALGTKYLLGQGVPRNTDEVMKWYRRAADQGYARAQAALGLMLMSVLEEPQRDYTEGVKWYRRAADQGNAEAQYGLALLYMNGQGVPQDYVQAHKWFNLAASRYLASQKWERDTAVTYRDRVAAKMTPAQIAEAQKLAREWKPTTQPPQ